MKTSKCQETMILKMASSIIDFDLQQDFLYGEEATQVYVNAAKLREAFLKAYSLGKLSNSIPNE